MPINTYLPDWDRIRAFVERMRSVLPPDYTGKAAIRLHRTGNPLTLELFGPAVPDKPLYPLVLLDFENGDLTETFEDLATRFDVPWVGFDDFRRVCTDVMAYYHQEDALEPIAEAILSTDEPAPDRLRKALVDHAAILAQS